MTQEKTPHGIERASAGNHETASEPHALRTTSLTLGDERSPLLQLGTTIAGQYTIESYLETGGFGDVYRAIQTATGQLVAIKILRPRVGKGAPSLQRQIVRFRREVQACAELHHPHIVRLIDSGETKSRLVYSVFEHVPGPNLADFLRDRCALTIRMTLGLMTQILDALICAHAKGIIHRDLKPQNIMVSTTGSRPQTTVLDFGISAFLEGRNDEFATLTMTEEILGTPAYAAPEQLRGGQPSPKSDLYSWGLIFVECLTGRRVFNSPTPLEMLHAQLSPKPVELPPILRYHWLGQVLQGVLEKDPARRCADAMLVMDRLADARPLRDIADAQGFLRLHVSTEDVALDSETRPTVREIAPPTTEGGECRQVTAMCCLASIDPSRLSAPTEALDRTLGEAQKICEEIAACYGGRLAANLGGELLMYFGIPQASDADSRWSAAAALEMLLEFARRNATDWSSVMELRIGIHTGMVTVPEAQPPLAVPASGVTSQYAARLARGADANSIRVSEESSQYLSPSFELEEAGVAADRKIYRLLAESAVESAATTSPPVPASTTFVGRERELALLGRAWDQAQAACGSTILILGDAGIGKSRLVREFRTRRGLAASRGLEARCLPETQRRSLRPIRDLLTRALNVPVGGDDQASQRLDQSLRELGVDGPDAMPLLCPWFGLPLPSGYQPLPSSSQKQKSLLLDLLVEIVVAVVQRRAAPIFIEDLHWADSTTLDYVERLVSGFAGRRASLLLLTARPECPLQLPVSLVERMELKGLASAEVRTMAQSLTADHPLPGRLIDEAISRSDGIPLFVEEIVRFLKDEQPKESRISAAQRTVPSRLRTLLTGRLDRLGRAKRTAQMAAAIGREFDFQLLARAFPGDEAALLADLEQMVSAQLLFRRRSVDGQLFGFCHALIRDAAYESMLASARRDVHRRIAAVLERDYPTIASARPELLAHHWTAGEEREKAIHFARLTIESGLARSPYAQVIAYRTDEPLSPCPKLGMASGPS